MSFSYVDPSNSQTDAVRFLLGDTENTKGVPAIFQDEEIAWALTEGNSDTWQSAAICADVAVAKFARQPTSKTFGETSITFGNLAEKFRILAVQLRASAKTKVFPVPWSPSSVEADRTPIAIPLSPVPDDGL